MKKEFIPIVPPDLDLGDIQNVKVGDELAIFHTHNGDRKLDSRVVTITEVNKEIGLVRTGKAGSFWLKYGGAVQYFMHNACFYYSANPEHIKYAKILAGIEAEQAEKKKEFERKQMELAEPIGKLLGDGWKDDNDGGGEYYSKAIATELAEKLNAEQLRTLASWLKIS